MLEHKIYWPLGLSNPGMSRVYARGPMENGLRQGHWEFWYLSGRKQMEGGYKNGVKQGPWRKWWKNGRKASEGSFENGKMHGAWHDWHPEGVLAQESHWHYGRRSGTWRRYDKQGALVEEKTFDHRREKDAGYSMYTDREAREIMRQAAKAQLNRVWANLVGTRIARRVQPWQLALWLLFIIPAYSLLRDQMGFFAIPAALAAASLAVTVLTLFLSWHERRTRPDVGAPGP